MSFELQLLIWLVSCTNEQNVDNLSTTPQDNTLPLVVILDNSNELPLVVFSRM